MLNINLTDTEVEELLRLMIAAYCSKELGKYTPSQKMKQLFNECKKIEEGKKNK